MRPALPALISLWLYASAVGCGGASAEQAPATTALKAKAQTAPTRAAEPPPAPSAAAAATAPAPLAPQVDAGEIPRELLISTLAQGIGRFLQRVRVSAARDDRGRFAGWQIARLFPGEPGEGESVLQPGDVLLRVNGQSIERPEQLQTVWESLATSSDLTLTVRRFGAQSDVRYRISAPVPLPAGAAPPLPASATRERKSKSKQPAIRPSKVRESLGVTESEPPPLP